MKHSAVKSLVLAAMLAALQVVLSKFLMVQASPTVRFSIDSVPIELAGLLLGPVFGAIVGALGDMLGTILFPTAGAWYPPLTAAYAVIGLIAGLFGGFVRKKPGFLRILAAVAAAELIGSLAVKTAVLSTLSGFPFMTQLLMRIIPVGVNLAADVLLVFALYRILSGMLKGKAAPAMEEMTYDEALSFIHSVDWRGSVFGLERIERLLSLLGNPEKTLKFVHVAGTNGKGSTSAMLSNMLLAAEYKVGLYISPYITRFNERIQVNGAMIPDGDLARITALVRSAAAGMDDKPTEFELVTAIGFYYFAEQRCDIVVAEVGMGGRLDATNVIPCPALSVITNIGLDHTKILGDTLSKIAFEKAGILKEGGDAVYYGHEPEADAVIEKAAIERHVKLTEADFSRIGNVHADLDALTFDFAPYQGLTLRLVGTYQLHNAAVAITAAEQLAKKGWRLDERAIRAGLAAVRWPGRFEVLSKHPLVIVDGGHTPQGVRAAVESLQTLLPDRDATILLGIMADKDVAEVLSIVRPAAKRFVTVTPDNPRALPADELARQLTQRGA